MSRSKSKSSGDVAAPSKKCQAITMETKVKIIDKVEQGKKDGRTFAHSLFTIFMDLRRWMRSPKRSTAT